MKKLINQLIRFGLVGAFCFVVDMVVSVVLERLGVHHLVAAFFGFVISVTVNYILSFKFVFERKEDLDRRKEFVIFVILSVIGLGVNELFIWLSVDVIYENVNWIREILLKIAHTQKDANSLAFVIGKVFATAVVMVYNFVTRKIFLEKKS